MDDNQKKQAQFSGAYLLLALAALLFIPGVVAKRTAPKAVPMSELLQHVRDGNVGEVLIRDAEIVAELKAEKDQKPERIAATRLPGIDETTLVKELQDKGVSSPASSSEPPGSRRSSWAWLLPIAVLAAIWFFLMRRMQGGRGGPLSIGKNKATIYDATRHGKVTFEDVAGVDEAEAELVEVVDFLKNPALERRWPLAKVAAGGCGCQSQWSQLFGNNIDHPLVAF